MTTLVINPELTLSLRDDGLPRYNGSALYKRDPARVDRDIRAYRATLVANIRFVDRWIAASGRCPRCGGTPHA